MTNGICGTKKKGWVALSGRIEIFSFPRAFTLGYDGSGRRPDRQIFIYNRVLNFSKEILTIFVLNALAHSSFLQKSHQQKGKNEQVREETGCKHRLV